MERTRGGLLVDRGHRSERLRPPRVAPGRLGVHRHGLGLPDLRREVARLPAAPDAAPEATAARRRGCGRLGSTAARAGADGAGLEPGADGGAPRAVRWRPGAPRVEGTARVPGEPSAAAT